MPWPYPETPLSCVSLLSTCTRSPHHSQGVAVETAKTYSLCDIIYDHCAVRVPVVHRRQRLVSFLSRCIPDLEFHSCALIECDGLCEEGCADGGFPVIIELILEPTS